MNKSTNARKRNRKNIKNHKEIIIFTRLHIAIQKTFRHTIYRKEKERPRDAERNQYYEVLRKPEKRIFLS